MKRNVIGAMLAGGLLALTVTLHANTVSKKVAWANDKWIPLNLVSEGVQIKEVRFAVEGGVSWNPLRAGSGPQCFVSLKNTSDHGSGAAVAVALFDGNGDLIGATESSNIGTLNPGESKDIKLTFRDVKRRFFEAKTAQIALETFK